MDPRVRDLYRRFLFVGRDYPLGLAYVRDKAKAAFLKNRDLKDPVAIKKAVKKGRWMVRELVGVIQLKKYRTLNSRYTSEELQTALRNIELQRALDEDASDHQNGPHHDDSDDDEDEEDQDDDQARDQDQGRGTTGTHGRAADAKKATRA